MRIDPNSMPANFVAARNRAQTLNHKAGCQCSFCRKASGEFRRLVRACRLASEAESESHDHNPTPQIPDAEQLQQPATLAGDGEGKAPSPGLPLVRFVLRRVRLLDVDAKYGSCKSLLDGVVASGLVNGDREDQICLEVRQEKVGSFKEEETLIEVHNPDGPATRLLADGAAEDA